MPSPPEEFVEAAVGIMPDAPEEMLGCSTRWYPTLTVEPDPPVSAHRGWHARRPVQFVGKVLSQHEARLVLEDQVDGAHPAEQAILVQTHLPPALARGDPDVVEHLMGPRSAA
jgi:hypothetical protein